MRILYLNQDFENILGQKILSVMCVHLFIYYIVDFFLIRQANKKQTSKQTINSKEAMSEHLK